jgi:hypothetical protein
MQSIAPAGEAKGPVADSRELKFDLDFDNYVIAIASSEVSGVVRPVPPSSEQENGEPTHAQAEEDPVPFQQRRF